MVDAFDYLLAVTDRVIAAKYGVDSPEWQTAEARLVEVVEALGKLLERLGCQDIFQACELPSSYQDEVANAARSCDAVLHIMGEESFPFLHQKIMEELATVMQELVDAGWGASRGRRCVTKLQEALKEYRGEMGKCLVLGFLTLVQHSMFLTSIDTTCVHGSHASGSNPGTLLPYAI